MNSDPFGDVAPDYEAPVFRTCQWIPGDAVPSCDFDEFCPDHGRCVGCGEPLYIGSHGAGNEYGGCV